jgi:CxxC-x17-CxxC domain-containing protein
VEFVDRRLQCLDCGEEFVWTAGEQRFYAERQLQNEPKRCRACKSKHFSGRPPRDLSRREPVETAATCSSCGKETTVPFRPSPGRPIYCRECFQQRKGRGGLR